jgi:hypothetical protein
VHHGYVASRASDKGQVIFFAKPDAALPILGDEGERNSESDDEDEEEEEDENEEGGVLLTRLVHRAEPSDESARILRLWSPSNPWPGEPGGRGTRLLDLCRNEALELERLSTNRAAQRAAG